MKQTQNKANTEQETNGSGDLPTGAVGSKWQMTRGGTTAELVAGRQINDEKDKNEKGIVYFEIYATLGSN